MSTAVPGFIDDVLRKWPGRAAVRAHRSVIRLLSPVWSRKCSASASRLLKAWPHSLHAYWGRGEFSGDVIVVTSPLFDWLTTVTVCG